MNFKFWKKDNITESELEEIAIQENSKDNEENKVTGIIIQYIQQDGHNDPAMIKLSDFHNDILPQPNSIIWISNKKNLLPYKVIRYDYIEDENIMTSKYVYIVVTNALPEDVLSSYTF